VILEKGQHIFENVSGKIEVEGQRFQRTLWTKVRLVDEEKIRRTSKGNGMSLTLHLYLPVDDPRVAVQTDLLCRNNAVMELERPKWQLLFLVFFNMCYWYYVFLLLFQLFSPSSSSYLCFLAHSGSPPSEGRCPLPILCGLRTTLISTGPTK
jgi:hypothetical protein